MDERHQDDETNTAGRGHRGGDRLGRDRDSVGGGADPGARCGQARFRGDGVKINVGGGVLEVADCGPGIPDSDLAFVFDRFYRSPAARAHPGSGLGLAIVRQVAQAHGGTAQALPNEGGALLRMVLPSIEVVTHGPHGR
ncbi:hypothetical protein Rhe02_16460 [Rhizocola hellebori]|uniref:histidine kinase n=1 Tax=Rhizocola hellebori TaxID=1392758 RepID=A0A8J3VDH5_9ACTN|nr:ATP-binding protein [Rhizocola hellebori]GIH03579.1 hypothetical protein Rhe02_16460 [Rhizocola hellebori]